MGHFWWLSPLLTTDSICGGFHLCCAPNPWRQGNPPLCRPGPTYGRVQLSSIILRHLWDSRRSGQRVPCKPGNTLEVLCSNKRNLCDCPQRHRFFQPPSKGWGIYGRFYGDDTRRPRPTGTCDRTFAAGYCGRFSSVLEETKDSISLKKALHGDGSWLPVKEILGWILNTNQGTLQLPEKRRLELQELLNI